MLALCALALSLVGPRSAAQPGPKVAVQYGFHDRWNGVHRLDGGVFPRSNSYGASLAAKEGMWLRDLLADLGYTQEGPTALKLDSKSAIDMALDPVAFRKTKHILRAANFLRDLVARRVFQPEHIPGTDMVADLATKPLPRAVFQHLMTLLAAASM